MSIKDDGCSGKGIRRQQTPARVARVATGEGLRRSRATVSSGGEALVASGRGRDRNAAAAACWAEASRGGVVFGSRASNSGALQGRQEASSSWCGGVGLVVAASGERRWAAKAPDVGLRRAARWRGEVGSDRLRSSGVGWAGARSSGRASRVEKGRCSGATSARAGARSSGRLAFGATGAERRGVANGVAALLRVKGESGEATVGEARWCSEGAARGCCVGGKAWRRYLRWRCGWCWCSAHGRRRCDASAGRGFHGKKTNSVAVIGGKGWRAVASGDWRQGLAACGGGGDWQARVGGDGRQECGGGRRLATRVGGRAVVGGKGWQAVTVGGRAVAGGDSRKECGDRRWSAGIRLRAVIGGEGRRAATVGGHVAAGGDGRRACGEGWRSAARVNGRCGGNWRQGSAGDDGVAFGNFDNPRICDSM
ncbi:uncharacterized PE-PGRS family protein PE_PGRS54-like [Eucalyptus grandis]|uniref:uncharacterized PE-PGRS family protein PE_PGRS54-like n=1 Tax=Eucalyptus grandis TaxID=71139 RepID=UPI00192E7FE0|nr:uncharacterized PE-PGRS family protein PE_PGRS54-like [Eucalyptus grandis]